MTEHKERKKTDDKDDEPKKGEEESTETSSEDSKPEAADESTTPKDADTTPFDDEATDRAINDIVATESDELLAAEDAATPGKIEHKSRNIFARWWHNKWARWITILLILGGIGAIFAMPAWRYKVLNAVGVRSSLSVVVVDSTTQLPLKGVRIAVGEHRSETDEQGAARVSNLKLGPQEVTISRVGFAEVKRTQTIGWGSNPLGTVALKAVGVQYVIEVYDYVSDKPLEGVTASSGQASAKSDVNGKITLTLESTVVAKDGVTLSLGGYRSEAITLEADPTKPTKAVLALARKAVFAQKVGGRYDVFKSDIDGKNKQLLLAGTGKETANLSLVTSPDGARAALVSTRDGKKDAGGQTLQNLLLINVETGETVSIAESPHIRLLDWIGPRIVFEQIASDTAASNRYTVTAYAYTDNTRVQLAAANNLVAATTAQGALFYLVGAGTDTSVPVGAYRVNPDGGGKQHLFDQEVSTLLRTDYSTFALQVSSGWRSLNLANNAVVEIAAPASATNRIYLDNASRTYSLWLQQGNLKSYDVAAKQDAAIAAHAGIAYPMTWLSETTFMYRMATNSETADYVASVLGGTPHKVSDVASSYGFGQTP